MSVFKIIKKNKDGTYRIFLSKDEFEWLKHESMQLANLISRSELDEVAMKRLFPAGSFEQEIEQKFEEEIKPSLLNEKIHDLKTLSELCEKDTFSKDDLDIILCAINSIRLTLGTILAMTPDGPAVVMDQDKKMFYAYYNHLSYLQQKIVEELIKEIN